ncbi:Zinc finger BED domain-containing protein 4 [Frankliniella fusca]|uniref:Zinc finger BED domain-containing protein 4 n=1 Tax=Frankliniella fusca TaxID=407009 RepID=A0AAE1HBH4_9NEOP|nr:Zinc finger BED domain-containing protein 4 [Frankliniella fusca]
MGRKKAKVWAHFECTNTLDEATKKTKSIALCKYCNASYKFPNATRLNEHLATQCKPCPADFKIEAKNALRGNKTSNRSKARCDSERSETVDDCDACDITEVVRSVSNDDSVKVTKSHDHPTKSKQISISSFVERTTDEKKKKIDEKIARAVYVSGAPLSMFDSPYWIDALKELRPTYKVPSTYEFSTPLLNAEYTRVMDSASAKLKSAVSCALLCDGWSNNRREGILNFLVSTPAIVFLKNVVPGENREDADFVSKQLITVVEECEEKYKVDNKKFFILITDNATVMKAAWVLFLERFPHMTAAACSAHSFNLLFGDIMKQETLSEFYVKVKTVIKAVKCKSVVKAVFKSKQAGQGVALQLPPRTRWCYVVICLESLLANKYALQETVISVQLKDLISKEVRSDVLDDDGFWVKVKNLHDFLQPLHVAILRVEGDDATLSIVPEVSHDVRTKMQSDLLSNLNLDADEESNVQRAITERLYHCNLEVHFAANLLDPRYKGKKLDNFEIHSAMDYINKQCNLSGLSKGLVLADLAAYRTASGFYEREYLWESAKELKPTVWWGGLCASQPLEPLASRILSVPPTSAGCERDWSIQASIHSKNKNRFKNERVEKLKAVRQNLKYSVNALLPKKTKKKLAPSKSTENVTSTENPDRGGDDEDDEVDDGGNAIDLLSGSESDNAETDDENSSESSDSDSDDDYSSEDETPLAMLSKK